MRCADRKMIALCLAPADKVRARRALLIYSNRYCADIGMPRARQLNGFRETDH